MAVTVTRRTGFFGNLKNAIVSALIGVVMFFASFPVLFMTEFSINWEKLAATATVVSAEDASSAQGFVAVTGTLTTEETVGDPLFVQPGPYITLNRDTEMYAWRENTRTETRDKVGGGTETITHYDYEMVWTSSPQDSSRFQQQEGHRNPAMPSEMQGRTYQVQQARVGAFGLAVEQAQGSCILGNACHGMPGGQDFIPSEAERMGALATAQLSSGWFFLGGSATAPQVGDMRVRFRALRPGGTVTAFGQAEGGRLVPATVGSGQTMLRVFPSSREDALSAMRGERAAKMWILRVIGFFMMWTGMTMVFAPLHAMAGILPFIKRGTTFLVNLITFPIALFLTGFTILVGKFFANPLIAIVLTLLVFGGIMAFLYTRRKKTGGDAGAAVAAAGGANFMPPGPPPGDGFTPPGPPPA